MALSPKCLKRVELSLALVALLVACQSLLDGRNGCAEALRVRWRSVRKCDQTSFDLPASYTESDCEKHCKLTYVRISPEILQANEGKSRSHLMPKPGAPAACCCIFEALWPDFVNVNAVVRRGSEQVKKNQESPMCLPLFIGINLSRRTRLSYDTVCKYLGKQGPMTMLELMQFAEAAEYLNYMRPNHPAIRHVINNKLVSRITKEEVEELRRAFDSHLLDVYQPLDDYDGIMLRTGRFREMAELNRVLPKALKAEMVERAVDELLISNMLIDVAAAWKHLDEMNRKLKLPKHLLRGEYDKYDQHLANYFSMPQIDCSQLGKTSHQLGIYLRVLELLSGTLFEKGVFQVMGEQYPYLRVVLEMQRVYENLLKVNCRLIKPAPRRAG